MSSLNRPLVPKGTVDTHSLRSHFENWLRPHWGVSTPGLCFEVHYQGQCIFEYEGGDVYPYYDLASLTKALFTVPAFMLKFNGGGSEEDLKSEKHRGFPSGGLPQGFWGPQTRVKDILPWWKSESTLVLDLLTHSSGLIWWKPFYKDLIESSSYQARWEILRKEIERASGTIPALEGEVSPLGAIGDPIQGPVRNSVYSDVGFMTLVFVLEELWKKPLASIWDEVKAFWAPKTTLHWIPTSLQIKDGPPTKSSKKEYAPTENCPWRGRILQGEVHDENAWALGGLSTHAGLFGNRHDVTQIFLKWREVYLNPEHDFHQTVKWFIARKKSIPFGDWAAGLMMPTLGQSSSGQFFSPESVGHTGFTGTSIWWDPKADLIVTLLSNRVALGRDRREFAKLRPLLHDEIIRTLKLNNESMLK